MALVPGWSRLRVRLLALLLLAFVPASGLLLQSHFERRRADARQVTEQALRLARLTAHDQERLFEETRRVLVGVASHPEVRSADPARCAVLLSSLREGDPSQYGSLLVADTRGEVFCSARPLPAALNIGDRNYVQDALRTRDFAVSDYQAARLTKRSILSFGYPILDEQGRVNGVVATALGLEWFSDLAARAQVPASADLLIVDRNRVILAHAPNDRQWVGQRVPDQSALASALDEVRSVTEVQGLDGVRRLYGMSHIVSGRSRFAVAVGMPLDALNEADRTLYRGLVVLALMGLITIMVAWTGVEAFVVRPLDSLRTAAHRLASGDLSGRAALKTGVHELDALGHDFDDMAHFLQEREAAEYLAREARHEAEDKYRHLVEQSLVGVYLVQDSGIIYVNPKCAEIFGYTAEELQHKSLLEVVDESDHTMVAQNVARRLSGEITSLEYSFRGRRKNGAVITVHVHGARTMYQGKPAIMGIMIDQTDQKALERQLLQAQKMEAVGRLAGGVAHDFNNLLTVITGYSEFLFQQLPSAGPERGMVEEIHKAAESASNLTRQLLAFSRNQVMQPEILSLNAVVSGFDKMVRRLIGEDIRVNLRLEPNLALAKVDPGQIEQVIMNLAVNARDAMPDGGTLTIETANSSLDEEYVRLHPGAETGPHVMLAVSDTGIGMSPETQARVFEPFFTTKERDKGTGLGLSTVYGIVKQSGGSIWLYSEPGRGTTFKIFLPVANTGVVSVATTAKVREGATGTETVLVVEDNGALRTWIGQALSQRGYRVIPLESSSDALAMSVGKQAPIHLLLTDVVLPGLNGPELASRLKKRWPQMKVLYMSGYTDDAVVPQGLLPAGETVLQKPFTAAALAGRVREALDAASHVRPT